jgi:hypothetical protein
MFKYIADSKIELFLEKDLQFANLTVLRLLRYMIISFTLKQMGHTTTYCVSSMGGKIITRLNFVMKSIYYLYFRSRHDIKIAKECRLDRRKIQFPGIVCLCSKS